MTFRLACIQTNSGGDIERNIASIRALVREAHDGGADLIALPEHASSPPRRRRPNTPPALHSVTSRARPAPGSSAARSPSAPATGASPTGRF